MELFNAIIAVGITCCHVFEQYFQQKGPVMDSQPSHVKNFMYFNTSGSGEVITLKYYTAENKNKFATQLNNLLGGRYFGILQVLFAKTYHTINWLYIPMRSLAK
jgi:hypothetical protein